MKQKIISQRFAVAVISILFGASALGWLLTEFIPADVPYRPEVYREDWGNARLWIVEHLMLYDPFHAFWYRAVLGLFFVVLAVCLIARWRSILLRPFRVEPPAGAEEIRSRSPRLEMSWREVKRRGGGSTDILGRLEDRYGGEVRLGADRVGAVFSLMAERFRAKGYHLSKVEGGGAIRFTASAGRWLFPGNLLFHLGILVITVGGMLGSIWGETEILYGADGDRLPLGDGVHSIVVERFEIVMGEGGMVKDYVSDVSVLDREGRRLETAAIEVNHPLTFGRFTVYQSSYYVGEESFRWALVEYEHPGDAGGATVRLQPDSTASLQGLPFTLRARRFLSDFRIGPEGPYSESQTMNNPAVEVEVTGGGGTERGWLFLYYPQFNSSFAAPVRFMLADVAPIYYTGLEVSTNPGGTVLFAGIAVATAGLLLLYLFNYRCIKGIVSGEGLLFAASRYRWKVSFREEFRRLTEEIIGTVSAALGDTH